MEGNIEEVGQLATAAAAAAVLDHDAAGRESAQPTTICANCGATVAGNFCGQCGQKAHVHRSISHVFEEFLHGITHFDSRFWRTIPMLLFRPGKLTRDYVEGKRARFIAPIALFLLTVFTMFLVFGFASTPNVPEGAINVDPVQARQAVVELDQQIARMDADIAAIRADPARISELIPLEAARTAAVTAQRRAVAIRDGGGYRSGSGTLADLIRENAEGGRLSVRTGVAEWDIAGAEALKNPELVFYKMKQKGYKLSFLLVPMSLPWMLLLFAWKRGVRPYDHVVFLLYSISFMSILFMLAAGFLAFNITNSTLFGIMFGVVPFAHMYAQLKEGYALGWFSAAWRTVVLSVMAAVTLSAYFALILLLGIID